MQVLPVWIAMIALTLLVGVVIWANQRESALLASEVRASEAESRAATAEAIVTAQAQVEAATETARAYVGSPQASVDRSLGLVLATEREPTDQHLRSLSDAFAPGALAVIRPEVEHLLSGGLHLGGQSGYDLTIVATDLSGTDQAQVQTQERWTYDERNDKDERRRCIVEASEQTYLLQKVGPDWQVQDIQLGSLSRSPCPDT